MSSVASLVRMPEFVNRSLLTASAIDQTAAEAKGDSERATRLVRRLGERACEGQEQRNLAVGINLTRVEELVARAVVVLNQRPEAEDGPSSIDDAEQPDAEQSRIRMSTCKHLRDSRPAADLAAARQEATLLREAGLEELSAKRRITLARRSNVRQNRDLDRLGHANPILSVRLHWQRAMHWPCVFAGTLAHDSWHCAATLIRVCDCKKPQAPVAVASNRINVIRLIDMRIRYHAL